MKFTRTDLCLLLLTALLIVIPLLPPPEAGTEGLLPALGRFHPLIVHFPIAFFFLLLVMELWSLKYPGKVHEGILHLTGGLAGLTTLAAILIGYFLYRSGDYQGALVQNHLWGGVGLGLLFILGWWFHRQRSTNDQKVWNNGYWTCLIGANLLLIYTGHRGGQLTHGVDYLTELLPSISVGPATGTEKPVEELLVYQDLIQPLFKKHCNSCHNQRKAKGGLILTSLPEINKGGKSGKSMIVSGKPEESELYARITLAPDHEDYMPPEGKPALPPQAVELLKWWILEGAGADLQLGEGLADAAFSKVILSFLPQITKIRQKQIKDRRERNQLLEKLTPLAAELGLKVTPDPATDSLYLGLSMEFPPQTVKDPALLKLEPFYHVFSKVSLTGSDITDESLHTLSLMPNLREIYLNRTCITGEGIPFLGQLPNLEILNLSHTDLDDNGALNLLELKALKRGYLFQTFVHKEVLEALRFHMPEVDLLEQEGPYY